MDSDTITIRLKKSQINELKIIATQKNISLNTLLAQVLTHHLEVDTIYDKFDWVKIPKDMFSKEIKKMTYDEIDQIGKELAEGFAIDFILTKWKEVSHETVSKFIKLFFQENSLGHCDISSHENGTIISIHHKLGKKASKMYGALIMNLFQIQLDKYATLEIYKNHISVQIPYNKHFKINTDIPSNITYSWYKSAFIKN